VRLGGSLRKKAGGVMLALWDWESMSLLAIISDHLVHAVRSTAPDGVLTKYLALPDASVLAVIGSGRLARWAAEAICAVRPIRQVRIWSPTPEHATACADYLRPRAPANMNFEAVASAEAAVREAHIVATATTAREPVLRGPWLSAGCTVITNRPEELDAETVRRGRLVTTYREGTMGHVPPYQALVETEGSLPELGEIMGGRAPGRVNRDEILVALNPAYGVIDAAVARFVYDRALQAGVGLELEP
jgi:ornithine cyclodeaminase